MNAFTSVTVSLGCTAKRRMSENLTKFSQFEKQNNNNNKQTNKTTTNSLRNETHILPLGNLNERKKNESMSMGEHLCTDVQKTGNN